MVSSVRSSQKGKEISAKIKCPLHSLPSKLPICHRISSSSILLQYFLVTVLLLKLFVIFRIENGEGKLVFLPIKIKVNSNNSVYITGEM